MSEPSQSPTVAVTPLVHHIPNAQLVDLIPMSAKTVLEIGCGSGASGQLYLQRNPTARYIGLEISETYAAVARAHLSECHVGNIETIDVLQLTGGQAPDCIVFGDVLEHLLDPWALLAKLKNELSPNGCIAACVPNTGHWSVLTCLLSGQWPYADSGLFDRTHLRFFTQQSLRHLFESAGLTIVQLLPRNHIASANSQLVPTLLQTAQSFGISNPNLELELNTFQWLVQATAR
jgi:2-polyprenyl-3-methyl-5-hydroxy-6-metoxy-1,4-benzoquinol methylase